MFDNKNLYSVNTDLFRTEAIKFETNKRRTGIGFYLDAPKGV